jgi:hypothetical protein
MKKRLLTTSAAAVLLAGGAFFALQLANCGEQRATAKHAKVDILSSLWTDCDVHDMAYAMQWDDVSKKLLFDGMAICHDKPRLCHINFSDGREFVPPPKHPDEYSFDAGTIGDFCAVQDLSIHNGQIRFCLEWDDSQERFLIRDASPPPRNDEVFMFNTGTGWR